jgi:hypothetical protein
MTFKTSPYHTRARTGRIGFQADPCGRQPRPRGRRDKSQAPRGTSPDLDTRTGIKPRPRPSPQASGSPWKTLTSRRSAVSRPLRRPARRQGSAPMRPVPTERRFQRLSHAGTGAPPPCRPASEPSSTARGPDAVGMPTDTTSGSLPARTTRRRRIRTASRNTLPRSAAGPRAPHPPRTSRNQRTPRPRGHARTGLLSNDRRRIAGADRAIRKEPDDAHPCRRPAQPLSSPSPS